MTIAILCGGLGTRLRDANEVLPKPMVPIGAYPIVWHIMKHYDHYGFKDFVLCLGYKREVFIDYFTNYMTYAHDVTVELGTEPRLTYHNTQPEDWRVTLADTGMKTGTGGRLKRAARYIQDGTFMLTYGDGVSDIDLKALLDCHRASGKLATISAVHPSGRFGEVEIKGDRVLSFAEKPQVVEGYVNGGFMVLEKEFIERYIDDDESCALETDALPRACRDGQLNAYRHNGFWQCMDTPREFQLLNELWDGAAPWKLWR